MAENYFGAERTEMAVTIKDVAKQAGVSTATVSKVMNGSYSISQETIDRVKRSCRNWITIRISGREICHTVYKDHCLCDLAGEECRICQPAYV